MQAYDRNRTDLRAPVRRMRLRENPKHVKTVRAIVGRRRRYAFMVTTGRLRCA